MKKSAIIISSVVVAITLLQTGCAVKSGNEKLENMERNDISTLIKKGETTESGVASIFGEPQGTDFMQDGRKKWKYSFIAKREKGVNYVPVVNWFTKGTNDEIKSLLVLFKDGVVDDYIFSKSEGETTAGAFN